MNAFLPEVQRRQNPSGADPYAASNPPGWRFENGDWYDNRPRGYSKDYRGSNGNNNVFFLGLTPGSVGDWANGIRGTGANMAVMSSSTFAGFYGLDKMNDIQKAAFARSVGRAPTPNEARDIAIALWSTRSTYNTRGMIDHKEYGYVQFDKAEGGKFYLPGTDISFWDYLEWSNRITNTNGETMQAGFGTGELLSSTELAIAALKPSFEAAASQAKHGGSVPFFLKKNFFSSPTAVNNNAIRLGKVSGSFARNGTAIMKVAAPALTMTAIVTNGVSIFSDGQLTWGDVFVGANTALQIAFPVYGVAYGLVDVGTSLITGTSLTDQIKNGIDSNVSGSINVGF